jgi:hypothetical protein
VAYRLGRITVEFHSKMKQYGESSLNPDRGVCYASGLGDTLGDIYPILVYTLFYPAPQLLRLALPALSKATTICWLMRSWRLDCTPLRSNLIPNIAAKSAFVLGAAQYIIYQFDVDHVVFISVRLNVGVGQYFLLPRPALI